MSIDQINKLFQNKGCNIAMSVVLLASVATFIGGVGLKGCGAQNGNSPQTPQEVPIVTVGDLVVTRELIDRGVNAQKEQYGGAELPAAFTYTIAGQVLNASVSKGLSVLYAKQQGINLDKSLVKARLLSNQQESIRQRLEAMGKLKPGASRQEFETAFKAASGRSWPDIQKDFEQQLDKTFETPSRTAESQADVAFLFLIDNMKSKFMPTEAAIKADFDTLHLKVIEIKPDKDAKDNGKAKAEKVAKEIKAGLSFEAAMDKYSSATPLKGKKRSEGPLVDLQKPTLEENLSMKSLLDLKPGAVSDPIASYEGYKIYKLVSRAIDLPKDYAAQKAGLMDQKAKSDAAKAIADDIKKLDTPANVKWQVEGYHILRDYMAIGNDATDKPKKARDIIQRALKEADDPRGGEYAVTAAQMALRDATSDMAPKDANELTIQVLSAYSHTIPDIDAKLHLAEAYITGNDAAHTPKALLDTADANSIHTDSSGQSTWTQLNQDIKTAKTKNLIKPEDEQALAKLYTDWQKAFADEEAMTKAAMERQKKRDDELNKQGTQPPTPSTNPPGKTTTGKPTPEKPKDPTAKGKGKDTGKP